MQLPIAASRQAEPLECEHICDGEVCWPHGKPSDERHFERITAARGRLVRPRGVPPRLTLRVSEFTPLLRQRRTHYR